MAFKGKTILITAGPTWVPIDSVRVISNIATGETGILLARKALRAGLKVTLILGPAQAGYLSKKIKLIRFKFFADLKAIIKKELGNKKYDIVVHSAAVSDFMPKQKINGKIASGAPYKLELVPLPKIIRLIRRLAPQARLAMFKLETAINDSVLKQRAKVALAQTKADFAVANRLNPYRAFIIDAGGNMVAAKSKNDLAKKLLKIITSS